MSTHSIAREHAPRRIFLGVSGASGALYAVRTLQMLLAAGAEVDLCYSPTARRVLLEECDRSFDGTDARALLAPGQDPSRVRCHAHSDVGAPPASGTALGEAVVLVPCSLTTLAGVAEGRAGNLLERAAQVALKEGRRLVIVPREAPLTRTHLDQLSRLAWAGATVLPASPGFYHRPQSILDLVDHVCAKILGVLDLPQSAVPPWDGGRGE
ncbi:MAG: UbiX family flavin prenyltransferase [Planctomycetota bacterium]|nr:UbiX family flavin prenyltransferase [Planctomycetota bacterium]